MHNQSLKELLTKCELLLEDGDLDNLEKTVQQIMEMDFSNLEKEDFEEAIRILDFLMEKAEKKKQEIAEKLVNFQKFKGYLK